MKAPEWFPGIRLPAVKNFGPYAYGIARVRRTLTSDSLMHVEYTLASECGKRSVAESHANIADGLKADLRQR